MGDWRHALLRGQHSVGGRAGRARSATRVHSLRARAERDSRRTDVPNTRHGRRAEVELQAGGSEASQVLGSRRCGLALDRRSEPHPEILQLVENKTAHQILFRRRPVNARSTPASRSRPMASNTLLRGASMSATASSEDRMGAPGNSGGQSGCTSWHLMTATARRGSGQPRLVGPGCNDGVMTSTASPDADVARPDQRLEALFEELAELTGQRNAIDGRIVEIVAEVDRDELWGATGARSVAALVAWKTGSSSGNAKTIAVAQRLAAFPRCAQGMREGRLSLDQVGVIAGQAADGSDDHYAELARCATVSQLRT